MAIKTQLYDNVLTENPSDFITKVVSEKPLDIEDLVQSVERINMYCEKCGLQITEGSKFCSSCGKPQNEEVAKDKTTNEENIFADYAKPSHSRDAPDFVCGLQITENSKFCSSCGKPQNEEIVKDKTTNKENIFADYAKPSHSRDAPDFGFALLSFLVPLFGLIYWAIKRDETPLRAGSCIKGAVWGFIVSIPIIILLAFWEVRIYHEEMRKINKQYEQYEQEMKKLERDLKRYW